LHEARVYGLALRLLGDPVAAEETAQEAFVRLFRSLASLRGEAKLSTWLHRVTVNLCRDEHRRLKRAERFADLDSAGPRLVVVET
jgi:RNA polymerase sigma-70 factor (ECF subfamily)